MERIVERRREPEPVELDRLLENIWQFRDGERKKAAAFVLRKRA